MTTRYIHHSSSSLFQLKCMTSSPDVCSILPQRHKNYLQVLRTWVCNTWSIVLQCRSYSKMMEAKIKCQKNHGNVSCTVLRQIDRVHRTSVLSEGRAILKCGWLPDQHVSRQHLLVKWLFSFALISMKTMGDVELSEATTDWTMSRVNFCRLKCVLPPLLMLVA